MNFISRKWLESRQNKVRETLPNHGLCLDVGSGDFPLFPSTINLDRDPVVKPSVCADALNLPFRRGVFHQVYCNEVVEHLDDHSRFYAELCRVLRFEGRVSITSPDESFFWRVIWWFWTRTFGDKWHETHVKCFKIDDLSGFFRVLLISKVNYFLNFVIGEKVG